MRRQEAHLFAWCAAIVVTVGLYVLEPRAPIYYPVERLWRWDEGPGIAMFWYGRSLFALGAGALTLLVTRALLSRWQASPPPWAPRAASAFALLALVAALLRTVLHEYANWMR